KSTLTFSLVPEKTKALDRAFDLRLPLSFAGLRKGYAEHYAAFYTHGMDGLFKSLGAECFPAGASSEEAINDIPTSSQPEVIFRDDTTKNWAVSGLDYQSAELGQNGRLQYANTNSIYFFLLRRPDDVPFKTLAENPKLAMDLLLKGVTVQRKVGGQDTRVTSLGAPYATTPHADRFGRPWQESLWYTPYDDGIVMSYATVIPSGLVMVVKFLDSGQLVAWSYDLPKVLDYTYIPYSGKLSQWADFLQLQDRLPGTLRDIHLDFQPGKSLKVDALWAHLNLDASSGQLTPGAYLGLFMGFSHKGKEVAWDLRRVTFDDEDDDNYFVILKHTHPVPSLPEGYQKAWKDVVNQHHPYTKSSFEKDGSTRIAALLPDVPAKGQLLQDQPSAYTLYIARVGKVPEADMQARLAHLLASIAPIGSAPATGPDLK
ncbi:MAG: hypothetical protein KGI56_06100, partial [Acidobacteriota bacterium]|nr:hypothetical protein [Acidobacteriota bacterium]